MDRKRVTPSPPRRRRPHRSTVSLPPKLRALLEARGARSDKSHGPFNFTRVLGRMIGNFDAVVAKSDPRETRDLSQAAYDLVLDVLSDPLELEPFHIVRLGDYLADLQAFPGRARDAGIDPEELSQRINAYPFAEKLHLAQVAQIRHAPPLSD